MPDDVSRTAAVKLPGSGWQYRISGRIGPGVFGRKFRGQSGAVRPCWPASRYAAGTQAASPVFPSDPASLAAKTISDFGPSCCGTVANKWPVGLCQPGIRRCWWMLRPRIWQVSVISSGGLCGFKGSYYPINWKQSQRVSKPDQNQLSGILRILLLVVSEMKTFR